MHEQCQSLIDQVRVRLADTTCQRWPDDDVIVAALNEGICEAYAKHQNLFAKSGYLPIEQGARRVCLPACCTLLSVYSVHNAEGELVATAVAQERDKQQERLTRPSCLSAVAGGQIQISVDADDGCLHFEKYPHAGHQLKLKTACVPEPITDESDCTELNSCKARVPILNYAAGLILMSSDDPDERIRGRDFMTLFGGSLNTRRLSRQERAAALMNDDAIQTR